MKKRFTRSIALLLAAFLAVESVGTPEVSAAAVAPITAGAENIRPQIPTGEEPATGEQTSDVPEDEQDILSEASGQTETFSESRPQETVSENTTDTQSMMEELEQNDRVDYLYIEKQYLKTPDIQHFIVGIGGEESEITDVRLTLKNLYTGEETALQADEVSDGMAVFSAEFTDEKERSIYQAVAIHYVFEGVEKEETFEQIGVNAYFGVNEEVVLQDAPAEVSLSDVEANIITNDGTEVTTTADKITEALADADAQTVSKYNPEGLSASDNSKKDLGAKRAEDGNVVIVLDPGHDATHAGARGNGLNEEDLTLKIATYCKEELENYDGVTVYMTRSTAACPYPGTTAGDDNENRVRFAKSVHADAYVSIHLNASTGTGANGAAVYYPNGNYNASVGAVGKELAFKIQTKLVALGIRNNGIQIRNSETHTTYPDGSLADYYGVIRNSKLFGFPGIIIEHAFLTNAGDAANFLSSDDKLKKLAHADVQGIVEYYKLEERSDTARITITDDNHGKGTFTAKVKNVPAGQTVRLKVYPKNEQKKEVYYNTVFKNNGYSATIDVKFHDYQPGTYVIVAYTVSAAGKLTKVAKKEYEFTEPVYKNVTLSAQATSATQKKFAIKASNLADAVSAYVIIYNTAAKSKTKKYEMTKASDGSFSAKMAIDDFGKMGGVYKVTAYAVSIFGSKQTVASTQFTVAAPTMGNIQMIEQDEKKGTFTLKVPQVKSSSTIRSVTVEVWSQKNKSDLKAYTAKKSGSDYIVKGNIKYHDYNYGTFKTKVTVTTKNGVSGVSKERKITIKQPVANITATTTKTQAKTKLTISNVVMAGNIKEVKVVVCSQAGRKKDKVTYFAAKQSKAKWKTTINNADIGKSGKYYVTVFAKSDQVNSFKKVGTTSYEVTGPKIESAYIAEKQTAKGTFQVTVSGVSCKGGISKVEALVYRGSSEKSGVTYKTNRNGSKYTAKVKIADLGGKKGTYKILVTAYSKGGIATTYSKTLTVKMKDDVETDLHPIMGTSETTVAQMVAYYNDNASYPGFYANTDAPTIKKFCELYMAECGAEGVKAEVAFVQAMKETNFLRFGGDVRIHQFNFAGLGATGGGVAGASFPDVKTGIRAQVQHLKAYACTDDLVKGCVDGRFNLVKRGCAPYIEWLGINENPSGNGWATDPGYGYNIVTRIQNLKTYQ